MIYKSTSLFTAILHINEERKIIPVREFMLSNDFSSSMAVLRFDVERRLQHHLYWAKKLAKHNIRCTMYFHTRREAYAPKILQEIQGLGHEVGYHHECLDRCRGDFAKARELFLREVELFRKDGLEVSTVCSHGEAGLPKLGYSHNWDIFARYPDLLKQTGVLGEVYMRLDYKKLLYTSDTFSNYSQFWKRIEQAHVSSKLLFVLAHLHRWDTNPLRTLCEVNRDFVQNLKNRLFKERTYGLAY